MSVPARVVEGAFSVIHNRARSIAPLALALALAAAEGCARPGQRGRIDVDQRGVEERLQTMCAVRGGEDAQCRVPRPPEK